MQHFTSRQRVTIGGVIVLLLIFLLGLQLQKILTFHVVKTDPKTSNVGTITPYIRIYFNDVIYQPSLSVNDPQHIITNTSVDGKTVTLSINSSELVESVPVTLSINTVSNTDGKMLKNINLSFTPKKITVDELSKEQQNLIMKQQQDKPYSASFINFVNFDSLTDNGVTSAQLQNIEQDLFAYSTSVKKQYKTMAINKKSLVVTTHSADSASLNNTADFTVALDNTNFKTHIEFNSLDDGVTLTLTNQAGVTVYSN